MLLFGVLVDLTSNSTKTNHHIVFIFYDFNMMFQLAVITSIFIPKFSAFSPVFSSVNQISSSVQLLPK